MKKKKFLKPAEELFCRLYAGAGEYFNNATKSYAVAYQRDVPLNKGINDLTKKEKDVYDICSELASRLLRNDKIRQRCEKVLMEEFRDDIADKELLRTLKQNIDLSAKMAAIREYNRLRQRIVDKVDMTSKGEKIKSINYIVPKDGANSSANL